MSFLHGAETLLHMLVETGIVCLELIGVCILLLTAIKSLWGYIQRNGHVPLMLAEGIALALEFKLGGEVLRTVVVREWKELLILAGVVMVRVALTLLIHWEIRVEKSHGCAAAELKTAK